ncbi:PREDICTED: uncharacterized protein LOC104822783 [Tarenaya hassleriana]|uniref:uncharacterized protein LOC104822783 n=1 Tax=Tarenaya hassleriana TaxID=28532 RepID=UPI00053C9E32|nr:PREDICTED: uncharacterized protein LOC104822783 [Tarenaya hassleriana]
MADEKADRDILFLKLNGAEYGKEKSVRHYSSNHQMLLVGEGDFSFSLSLAKSFGFASNVCASSLDSYDDAVRKYKNARSNLETLKKLGASLLHGVDATDMHLHPCLKTRRFDRIVFNFPHAGFHGKESDANLIRKHRKLVGGFFSCASRMLREEGEVHVSHKNKAPFCNWNLEELASRSCLVMTKRVEFKKEYYPGYQNKRGAGSRCDEPFILGSCSVFMFRFSSIAKEIYAEKIKWRNLGSKKANNSRRILTPAMNDQPEDWSRLSYRLESLLDQEVRQRPYPYDIRNKLSNDIQMQYQGVPDGLRQRPVSDIGFHQSMTRHMQFENASALARQMPVLSSSVMLCREKRTQANEDSHVLEVIKCTMGICQELQQARGTAVLKGSMLRITEESKQVLLPRQGEGEGDGIRFKRRSKRR